MTELEKQVAEIIITCCKGKSRDAKPKKWAIDNNNVVQLVYWFDYYKSRKVMNLYDEIEFAIRKELHIGTECCADTTEKLNWNYI